MKERRIPIRQIGLIKISPDHPLQENYTQLQQEHPFLGEFLRPWEKLFENTWKNKIVPDKVKLILVQFNT